MTVQQEIAAQSTPRLRLSSKITGLIFWGAVLTGLLVVAVFIKQSEDDQRLKQEYQAMMVMHALENVLAPHQVVDAIPKNNIQLQNAIESFRGAEKIVGVLLAVGDDEVMIGAAPEKSLVKVMRSNHIIDGVHGNEMTATVYFDPSYNNIYAGRKNLIAILGVISFAFGLIMNRILRSMLTNPINKMTETAAAYASGDKAVRFDDSKNDEFGFMSGFINKALDSSENMHRQLEESFHKQKIAKEKAEKALGDLEKAKDRLVQSEKLASLGQLTAGIAHEIKNPLNFINNFSETSVELLVELKEALSVHLQSIEDDAREEITELMEDLSGDMDTIAKHGKRADSIVKNMLMHSRDGGAERVVTDINSLVNEAIGLAYHGERAVDSNFQVDFHTSFDDSLMGIMAVPQDITRVLINLLSNAFYATKKRKSNALDGDYSPTIHISTKSKDDGVEIQIRDNGTGIAQDELKNLFTPFFTTKPTGQGTGLGLSITHDIITKQHDGIIGVNSIEGEYTEFIVWLPSFIADEKRFNASDAHH